MTNEQQQSIAFKNKKFRRRSLDESLINPIKALVGSGRNRRQSTNDAAFQRGNLFYNSDRRRKKSDHEIFARFQDTTKERIRTAVSSDTMPARKNTPTMLRRISKHLIRAYSEAEKRNSITELPNENDESTVKASRESPLIFNKGNDSPLLLRQQSSKNYDTSSLSTTDSGIESRDDKMVSSDERSDDDENLCKMPNDMCKSQNVISRSFSYDDLTKNNEKSQDFTDHTAKTPVRRQYSLREERVNQINSSVAPSPVFSQKSIEKLNNSRVALQKGSDNYSSDEKISNTQLKGSRKKKKILQPIVNKIRKVSRSETTPHQQKLLMIDSNRLHQIVMDIISEKMKKMTYDHKQSSDRCRMISTTLENTLKLRLSSQPGNPEYKIIAVVYIGETRDQGICFATQCSYVPQQDLFTTATYQNNDMYVCATIMASRIDAN